MIKFTQFNNIPNGEHTDQVYLNPYLVRAIYMRKLFRNIINSDGKFVVDGNGHIQKEAFTVTFIEYDSATEDDAGGYYVIEDLDTVVNAVKDAHKRAKTQVFNSPRGF